ncbi:MAG: hypothetical protein K2Y35_18950 [Burkholderiales bacterium]|nr:hypothetical protein [Burkholderiales bacterium]
MSELGLYVVRVYRRDPEGVAGIVEDVTTGERVRFRSADVLWQVLRALPPSRRDFPTNASDEEET